MTLPDELVKAATYPVCIDSDRKHHPDFGHCVPGMRVVHPECAVAAVLRALPESEAVVEAGARVNATLDGSTVVLGHYRAEARRVILGIAKLADDA